MTWHQRENGQIMGLTLADIEGYPGNNRPYRGLNGSLRYFCPIHGSDHQRSFKLNQITGHFKCYSCGCWGYIDEINKTYKRPSKVYARWKEQRQAVKVEVNVEEKFLEYYESLKNQDTDGIAVRYLKWRGIPHDFALTHGLGYASFGRWAQFNHEGKLCRQWKRGRLVFPHTNPQIEVINLYGRAIGANDVPPAQKHDNLNLPKGVFNCQGLIEHEVILTEGAFDALSLLLAGYNAAAIFGVRGFDTRWVKSKEIIIAFDNDETGQTAWTYLADQLVREGKKVHRLDRKSYRGYKDINELWKHERNIQIKKVEYLPQGRGKIL